jgi:phosphoribosylglycinamide formyltransferase-1
MTTKLNVGALISGGGTNLQAIIDACESGAIDANMVFVGTDNPDADGLERARKHKIPTFVVDYRSIIRRARQGLSGQQPPDDVDMVSLVERQRLFPPGTDVETIERFLLSRVVAEAKLLDKMKSRPFDLLVLAGFMRNITPHFIDRVNTDPKLPRIMNIHPALLPSFPGVDGYGDTFKFGCKVGGCTVHFIDYGEDSGPIIGQKAYPIFPEDTLDRIKEKGLKLEWELYPECIQLYAEGRLRLVKRSYRSGAGEDIERTVVEITPP